MPAILHYAVSKTRYLLLKLCIIELPYHTMHNNVRQAEVFLTSQATQIYSLFSYLLTIIN